MVYEMMIVLTEDFNNAELKIWAFNFGKILKTIKCFRHISNISR